MLHIDYKTVLTGAPLAGLALLQSPRWPLVSELLDRWAAGIVDGRNLFDLVAVEFDYSYERAALELLSDHWATA